MSYDMENVLAAYERRVAERAGRLAAFFAGTEPFLVIQRPVHPPVWLDCGSARSIARNNLDAFAQWVEVDATDELPYMEPWAGVGVYASAFGCAYDWRDGESPGTSYRYAELADTRDAPPPDWRNDPIMAMVLEAIDRMREAGRDRLPISLTDTQSPLDTATLVVDSCEFLVGCREDPETAKAFLERVTDLVIEFSQEQLRRIGPNCAARPGHLMVSSTAGTGISLSDDNLSFCSPDFNEEFALPYNLRIAQAFGGAAVHSCGVWAHTMARLSRDRHGVEAVDCAAHGSVDPAPNDPAAVAEALRGKGIMTKVRVGSGLEDDLSLLDALAAPDLPLVVELAYQPETAAERYRQVRDRLSERYAGRP